MRSGAPVHERLRDDLKEKIIGRVLAPGVMLPSENTLSAQYRISRPSVRKALSELESERLVVKRPGLGTFVEDIDKGRCRASDSSSDLIGIDLSDAELASWYYQEILAGARKGCSQMGCRLVFFDENDFSRNPDAALKGQIVTRFDQWSPDKIEALRRRRVSMVAFNRFPEGGGICTVAADFVKESFKAVDHLVRLGHRRIAIVADDNPAIGGLRRKGYMDALRARGIPIREDLIYVGGAGRNPMIDMLDFVRESDATAYFAASASYYVSFLSPALEQAGARIPEDVSVIVFEDIEGNVDHYGPPLSCVRVPLREMGRRAACLLAAHDGRDGREIFPCELVLRDSCRDVRA